jgi:hypothetical protein
LLGYIRRQIAAGRSDGDDENGTLVAQRTPCAYRKRYPRWILWAHGVM